MMARPAGHHDRHAVTAISRRRLRGLPAQSSGSFAYRVRSGPLAASVRPAPPRHPLPAALLRSHRFASLHALPEEKRASPAPVSSPPRPARASGRGRRVPAEGGLLGVEICVSVPGGGSRYRWVVASACCCCMRLQRLQERQPVCDRGFPHAQVPASAVASSCSCCRTGPHCDADRQPKLSDRQRHGSIIRSRARTNRPGCVRRPTPQE